jgi:hypothetical protein
MALTSIYRSLTINTVSEHFSYTCTNHHITFNTTIHRTTTRKIDRFRSHGFEYRNTAETEKHCIVTSEHRLYWRTVLLVHWTPLMYTEIRILACLSVSNRRHVVAGNFQVFWLHPHFPARTNHPKYCDFSHIVFPSLFLGGHANPFCV